MQWRRAVLVRSASCCINTSTALALASHNIPAVSGLSVNKARCNGVDFLLSKAFTFAPRSINNCMDSTFPQDDARCSGVDPFASCAFTSAPCRISTSTASALVSRMKPSPLAPWSSVNTRCNGVSSCLRRLHFPRAGLTAAWTWISPWTTPDAMLSSLVLYFYNCPVLY